MAVKKKLATWALTALAGAGCVTSHPKNETPPQPAASKDFEAALSVQVVDLANRVTEPMRSYIQAVSKKSRPFQESVAAIQSVIKAENALSGALKDIEPEYLALALEDKLAVSEALKRRFDDCNSYALGRAMKVFHQSLYVSAPQR